METKYKVHSFYILLILVSIIIGLISVEWSAVPKLVDYITFALTLSSLILAGLAIIYSIYSNTSISSLLSEITSAAKEVRESSRSINQSNMELKAEVEKLPSRLDEVDENISDTKNIITAMSEKKDALSSSPAETTHIKTNTGLSESEINKFLYISSIRGLEVLLMFTLSKETGTSFSFGEFLNDNKDYSGDEEYLYGFTIATTSIGLIDYIIDAKQRFVVSDIHQYITDNIKKIMKERTISVAKEMKRDTDSDEDEAIARWLKNYYAIGSYFNVDLD